VRSFSLFGLVAVITAQLVTTRTLCVLCHPCMHPATASAAATLCRCIWLSRYTPLMAGSPRPALSSLRLHAHRGTQAALPMSDAAELLDQAELRMSCCLLPHYRVVPRTRFNCDANEPATATVELDFSLLHRPRHAVCALPLCRSLLGFGHPAS
jgi:hypothetical protein